MSVVPNARGCRDALADITLIRAMTGIQRSDKMKLKLVNPKLARSRYGTRYFKAGKKYH